MLSDSFPLIPFRLEFFKRSKESTQCVHRLEYGICQHLPDLAGNLPAGSYHCTGTMDPDSDPSKTRVLKHRCPEIIECLSSRAHFGGFASVSGTLLISADLCQMSQPLCTFPMPMQIPSNVSATVLISADLRRMS